ncbi:MAG: hybrid sensor histidine kinase/response regulator, partial [Acidobacteriia bacterium]|nr:hybrid sensor histidine kinase/response regulator [Terriglobia bacterium]
MAFIFLAYDIQRDNIDISKVLLLTSAVVLVAFGISKFTNRLLARPLTLLQQGIISVREGKLGPIRVCRTGDEVEYLGESLNAMIAALQESRSEIEKHHAMLEERIRQRTEALEEATQRALSASRAKSEFLANMSHELRTPMSGVLGMIDIVMDEELPLNQRESLEAAKGCANNLLALLNDILDLSKIEAGRMMLERIPLDVRSVVQDCVKALQPKCRQKGIAIHSSISSGMPQQLLGDPLRLRQIVTNLLSNAVKFTDNGSVQVRARMTLPASGKAILELEVADTGTGIPKDKQASIFEEFTQADGSVTRKYGGTGLGLTITRRLVEMHHGGITVESEVGHGSTFRVVLEMELLEQHPA